MGVGPRPSSLRCQTSYPPSPNPNPLNFTVEDAEEIGRNLVVKVRYPNCTNFEGKKIIVFKGVNAIWLLKQRSLDPHFSKNGVIVARFIPTDEGWEYARAFARNI